MEPIKMMYGSMFVLQFFAKRARERARKFFYGSLVASPFVHVQKRHCFKPMSIFFNRQFGSGGPAHWGKILNQDLACEQALHIERPANRIARERASERRSRNVAVNKIFPALCTRVSFRVKLLRDLSQLPQMENLLAG